MLNQSDAIATVAVKDMKAARDFYEGVLGFEVSHIEGEEAREYKSGNSKLLVYRSEFAGTNKATAVTWEVDVDKMAAQLKSRGVVFEHYDMEGVERNGDVHSAGPMRMAWFKDPDGNVLALVGKV